MSKTVAILGCGPVGLLTAYAVERAGHHPAIFSRKQKSVIPGSQHLHGPIPGITKLYPERLTQYVRIGTAEEYARKVYGDPEHASGWDNYFQKYASWNLVSAYNLLWEKFQDHIIDAEVDWRFMHDVARSSFGDVAISTIPQTGLCHNEDHLFTSHPYHIQTLPFLPEATGEELVVYNGMPNDPWFRWSFLSGICSMEYSDEGYSRLSEEDKSRGTWLKGARAVSSDCNCWDGVHRIGRWAEWRHGVTVYRSWERINNVLKEEGLC